MSRKLAAIVVVCVLVPAALCDVRIFFTKGGTGTGLTDPAMAFQPTGGLGNDGQITDQETGATGPGPYTLTGTPPTYDPGDIPCINPALGEFVYVWLQFYSVGTVPDFDEHGNPVGGASTYLPNNGVLFSASMQSTHPADQVFTWYKYDNSSPDEQGGNYYRWDNSADQLTGSTVSFTAVQGVGIKNQLGAVSNLGQQTRTALLGTIRPTGLGAFGLHSFTAVLDNYGLPAFAYKISTVNGGAGYPVMPVFGQYIVDIPEPAGLLLLGLAGLLIRRR